MHVTENTTLSPSGPTEVKSEVEEPVTTTATAARTSDTITTSVTSNTTTVTSTPVNGVVSAASVNGSVSSTDVTSVASTADVDSTSSTTNVKPEVNGCVSTASVNGSLSTTSVLSALDTNARRVISDLQCKVEAELDGDSNCSSSSCVDSLASNGCWGMPMEEESDASMRKRLFTSLSQSFPGSALSRMLHSMDTMPLDSDDEDLASPDKLSSSCFAEIRLDKGEIEDDELTSLAWLQDADLLKNINAGEDDDSEAEEQKENDEGRKNIENGNANFIPQAHPPHVPYNPLKHVNSKPPYSFSCLIFMAVEDSPQKKLPVKDIYNWILTHFPYFQNAPTGWKNSVRHNLSLNKCFKKVEKDKGQSIGKGSLWCIDPDYRPNLLQALRKTPYHPYHQLQMMSTMPQQQHIHHVHHALPGGFRPMPLAQRPIPNTVSPHLFPFLSRRLAQTQCDFDSEMQDVANTLVAMKGFSSKNSSGMSSDGSDESGPTNARDMLKRKFGYRPPRRRPVGPIICTLNPSEDHTYSATRVREEDDASGTSSIDNEYDFGSGDEVDDDISEPSEYPSDWDCGSDGDEVDGEVPPIMPRKRLKIDLKRPPEEDEDDEEMKKEGAKALLNLAGLFRTDNNNDEYSKPSPQKAPPTPPSTAKSSSRSSAPSSSSKSRSSSKPSSKVRRSKTPPPSSSATSASSSSSNSAAKSSAKSSSKPTPKLSASWSGSTTKASLKAASASPSLSASTSSLTIMTRRGKAAAEAAAASTNRMKTRGKKLVLSKNFLKSASSSS